MYSEASEDHNQRSLKVSWFSLRYLSGKRMMVPVALTLGLLLSTLFIRRTWTDGDEGRYVVLAQSVASGAGLRKIYLPGPAVENLRHPGYGIVLGIVRSLFPDSLTALRLVSLVSYLAFIVFFALILAKDETLKPTAAWTALLLGGYGVFFLSFAWRILTEMLFVSLIYGVFLVDRYWNRRLPLAAAAVTGIATGLAITVRPAGLGVAVAVILAWVIRRRPMCVLLFVAALACVYGPVLIRNYNILGAPSVYLSHFGGSGGEARGYLSCAISNIGESLPHYYLDILPRLMFFSLFDGRCLLCLLSLEGLRQPLAWSISLLCVVGWLARLKRRGVPELFWLVYWVFLAAYNQPDYAARGEFLFQARYLVPLLPLAGVFLSEGAWFVGERLQKYLPAGRMLAMALLSLAAAYVLATSLVAGVIRVGKEMSVRRLHDWDPRRIEAAGETSFARFVQAHLWLKRHATQGTIVISRIPQHSFLISGLKSIRYDGADMPIRKPWDIVERYWSETTDVVIVEDCFPTNSGYGRSRVSTLEPMLKQHSDELQLIYETPPPVTRIWKVTRLLP